MHFAFTFEIIYKTYFCMNICSDIPKNAFMNRNHLWCTKHRLHLRQSGNTSATYPCCKLQPAFGCLALQILVEVCFFIVFHVKSWKSSSTWQLSKQIFSTFLRAVDVNHVLSTSSLIWLSYPISATIRNSGGGRIKKTERFFLGTF